MESHLSLLKVRAVRLGLMAAFVVTFLGMPTLGYQYDYDSYKKLDVFDLGENFLGYSPEQLFIEDSSLNLDGGLSLLATAPQLGKARSPAQAAAAKIEPLDSLRNFFSSVFSF